MANKNRKPLNIDVWREIAGDADFERAMLLNNRYHAGYDSEEIIQAHRLLNRYHTRLRKLETKPKSTKDLSYLLVS